MVKARVSLFSDRRFAHFYSLSTPIQHAFPGRAGNENKYLGRVFYKNGGLAKRIDIYEIDPEKKISSRLFEINRSLRKIPPGGFFSSNTYLGKKVDNAFSITYYLELGINEKKLREIKRNVRLDICMHLHSSFENRRQIKAELNKIEDQTTNKPIAVSKLLNIEGGKADFVPICKTGKHNIDFGKGCISYITKEGLWDPTAGCQYCYSGFKNSIPLRIPVFDERDLMRQITGLYEKGQGPEIIRLGKNSDPGHEFFRDLMVKTLELAKDLGIRLVVVTKYLKFDKEIAELLAKTKSSVQYSFGIESLEYGAVQWGRTNHFRAEQLLRFRDKGVHVVTRVVADVTEKPDESVSGILSQNEEQEIGTIITPIRLSSKELAPAFTCESWDLLQKDSSRQLPLDELIKINSDNSEKQRYFRTAGGWLLPMFMDRFYSDNFKNICGHIGNKVYCAGCGIFPPETISDNELPAMTYTKKPPKMKKNRDKATKKFRFSAS